MKPNLITKSYNFLKALIKRILGGVEDTDQKTYWYRITTCNNCEELDKQEMECTVCGCPVKLKTKWQTESCPLNKW